MCAESLQNIDQQLNPADMPQEAPDENAHPPLIVTSDELRATTKLFSEYFIEDYKKLMRSISDHAAQLVIYSGSATSDRLDALSKAGFEGLGSFKELTFQKIILLLGTVFLGAFAVFDLFFSVIREPDPGQLSNLALTTKIAVVYAFSDLCGTLIGSSRRLMKKAESPWGWYLMAGILGWLVWFTVTVLVDFNPDLSLGGNALKQEFGAFFESESLSRGLPWSILPFVFAMGVAAICRHNPFTRETTGTKHVARMARCWASCWCRESGSPSWCNTACRLPALTARPARTARK